jgi:hypothetical protein
VKNIPSSSHCTERCEHGKKYIRVAENKTQWIQEAFCSTKSRQDDWLVDLSCFTRIRNTSRDDVRQNLRTVSCFTALSKPLYFLSERLVIKLRTPESRKSLQETQPQEAITTSNKNTAASDTARDMCGRAWGFPALHHRTPAYVVCRGKHTSARDSGEGSKRLTTWDRERSKRLTKWDRLTNVTAR